MFLFCCLLIGAVIAGLVLVPRHLRHSTLQRLGWFWNDKPDLRITVGLNLSPFGIGMNRIVKRHVVGRSRSGLPFQAFRYSSDFWDGKQ